MSVRFYSIVIDCADVAAQGRWWAAALGWKIVYEAPDEVCIAAPHEADESRQIPLAEHVPGITFVPVPEGKTVKNRLHIDLAPGPDDDQSAEVERLVSLGAKRADVGQDTGSINWVVLTDPEGNEFCVLSAREK